jgi:citronellol/citronellal dehydrogenase
MGTRLAGKVALITGAGSGIGAEMALLFAAEGARVVVNDVLAERAELVAESIRSSGGEALVCIADVSSAAAVAVMFERASEAFGGIDILVNNASAISLTGTAETPMKRFDLMFGVNVRGTYVCSQACLPYLKAAAQAGRNPHVLNLSPPLNLNPKWFKNHVAYTMAKYGMSMCVLGMAEEFRADGIAVNALWPRTVINTAAIAMIPGVDPRMCRSPEILADTAYIVLNRDARKHTGRLYIDEEVLAAEGVTDLGKYAVLKGNNKFLPDLFVD